MKKSEVNGRYMRGGLEAERGVSCAFVPLCLKDVHVDCLVWASMHGAYILDQQRAILPLCDWVEGLRGGYLQ